MHRGGLSTTLSREEHSCVLFIQFNKRLLKNNKYQLYVSNCIGYKLSSAVPVAKGIDICMWFKLTTKGAVIINAGGRGGRYLGGPPKIY
jgi:hypothetical protein